MSIKTSNVLILLLFQVKKGPSQRSKEQQILLPILWPKANLVLNHNIQFLNIKAGCI